MKSFIAGLTGNSGAGKTTACNIFHNYGYTVIDCDKVAHEVLKLPMCAAEIVGLLGKENVTKQDGTLDRSKIGDIVFSDKDIKARYLDIVFPYISANVTRRLHSAMFPVLLDAPTLFESGLNAVCDIVIAVVCDEEIALRRVTQRDKITSEQARMRIDNGKSKIFFTENSDYCIENNGGTEEFKQSVCEIIKKIKI